MPESPSIWLNGAPRPWSPGLSVAALVQAQGQAPETVATALNGAFIARDARAATLLQPGDQLTLFQAIVGG